MSRFLVACGAAVLLVAGCAGKQPAAGGGSKSEVSRKQFQALEKRVADLEKKGTAGTTAAAPSGDMAKRLAALEAKLKKVAAGSGVSMAGPMPRIGLMNEQKNIWKCVKVDKGPTVDGKLDDAAWKKAIQVKLVSDEGKRVANDTAVLICHDTKNFYIAALCMESEMDKLKIKCTKRDEKVYGDDCIEFYIDQELDRTDAVKLVVNPNGVFMDFLRDLDGDAGDVTWKAVVKTVKLKDRYFMEISIPLRDMGLKYKKGLSIGFNPYRMRHGGGKLGEYTTWWGECNKIAGIGKVIFE